MNFNTLGAGATLDGRMTATSFAGNGSLLTGINTNKVNTTGAVMYGSVLISSNTVTGQKGSLTVEQVVITGTNASTLPTNIANASAFRAAIDVPQIYTNWPTIYVATNGNNATARLGRGDLPYATISTAVSNLTAGQRLLVRDGNYFEGTNGGSGAQNYIRPAIGTVIEFEMGAVCYFTNQVTGSSSRTLWRPADNQVYINVYLRGQDQDSTMAVLGSGPLDTVLGVTSANNVSWTNVVFYNLRGYSPGQFLRMGGGVVSPFTNYCEWTFYNPIIQADRAVFNLRDASNSFTKIFNPHFVQTNILNTTVDKTKDFCVIELGCGSTVAPGNCIVVGGYFSYSDAETTTNSRPSHAVWKDLLDGLTPGDANGTNNLVLIGTILDPYVTNSLSKDFGGTNSNVGYMSAFNVHRRNGTPITSTNVSFGSERMGNVIADSLTVGTLSTSNLYLSNIVVRVLGSTNDTSNVSTYSVALTNAPATNSLVLVGVVNSIAASATVASAVTNGNQSFNLVANTNFSTIASPTKNVSIWRAMTNIASGTTIKADFGGVAQSGCNLVVLEITGVDNSGANGAGAIMQAVLGATESITNVA